MGTYNIWDSCGFELLQAIRDVEKYNYNLMILNETKIFDEIYCHNRLGYDVVCSKKTVIAAEGDQGGVELALRE